MSKALKETTGSNKNQRTLFNISTDVSMDFDANSFEPSVMWDEKSKYPRTETGYAFTPDVND